MGYMILSWQGRARPDGYEALLSAAENIGLAQKASGTAWTILASPGQRIGQASKGGILIGDLFRRDGSRADLERVGWPSGTSPSDIEAELGRDFWGRYLAVIEDDAGALQIYRDPSGGIPCLFLEGGGYDVIVADLMATRRLDLARLQIDWSYLGHHIAYNGARSPRTGLVDVLELLPGQSLTLRTGRPVVSTWWRPADFLGAKPFLDPDEAARALYGAIERTTSALARAEGPIIIELSGGLDSSLIAIALRRRPQTYAVNCTTSGPEGDERHYARQVASAAHLPLIEHELSPSDIDFRRPPAPWMPRPGRTTVLQTVDGVFSEEGQRVSATAFLNGTGGDSIFFYRLLAQGLGGGFLRSVQDVAELTGASFWRAGRAAIRLALKRSPPYQPSGHPEFLTPAFRPSALDPHPWLEGLEAASPGRLRHVRGIVAVHGHVDGHDRNQVAPVVAAHAAQPVLETVLRIPTWMWISGGRDRAVARQAYAAKLPADVLNRRSKGRINRFIAEAFEANRAVIGSLLRQGVLAREGVIDMAIVDATLAAPLVSGDTSFMGVIRLVDVELWAQGWTAAPGLRS